MPGIIDKVTTVLAAAGVPFEREPDAALGLVRLAWPSRGGPLVVVLEGWDEARRLKVYVYCPGAVPAAARRAVGELLHRVNWALSYGSFELHPDTGAVRFRAGTIVGGVGGGGSAGGAGDGGGAPGEAALDATTLQTLVEGSAWVVEAHLPALQAVIDGVATPAEAAEEAEALLRKRAG